MPAGTPPSDPSRLPPPAGPGEARRRTGNTALGAVLVLVGGLFLLGQVLHVDVGHYGWPLFVVGPGVALFILGLLAADRGEGLAITGTAVTVTGLILFVQNTTDDFESWAYAWALIFPGSVGLGLVLFGLLAGRPRLVRPGMRTMGVGLTIFLVGAIFFEGVIGISGRQFGRATGVAVSALVIALGVLLLVANTMSARRGDSR